MMSKKTLAIINANVVTLDDKDTVVEAIAIKDGRITALGSNTEIKSLTKHNRSYKTIDLKGKTVLPGFIETHGHLVLNGEFESCVDAGSPPNESIEDIISSVAEYAKNKEKGEWIIGKGYNRTKLEDNKFLDRFDLDKATTDHPVVIQPFSGPMAFVNSLALEKAGITRETPNPTGSEIVRVPGSNGEPNGVLKGYNAMGLVFNLIPSFKWDEIKYGLGKAQENYFRQGITSFHEPKLARFVLIKGHDALKIYQRGVRENFVKLRTNMMIHDKTLKDLKFSLETGLGNEKIRVGGVSYIGDGAHIYLNAAALSEPYLNNPREKGYWAEPEINEEITEMQRQGYQILIHAMGDRGISIALDAFENANKLFPRENTRHRVEHALLMYPEHIQKMKEMGIMPNFSIQQVNIFGDRFIDTFLGQERANRIAPVASVLSAGIKPLMHSEAGTPCPLFCVQCAVSRKTNSGQVLNKEERVSVKDALKMITTNAAYASFEENIKGTLEKNKLGDLVILERDPFVVEPDSIGQIPILSTIIDGEIVYSKDNIF
ncbi:MAG: hypothetical protein APR54_09285 [Candidatus Cloacimonas sp. SDB]|nr:MAG: hypothetical protein APR54_09285 [Candidatus Cloacimonas sp. SDB]